MLCVYYCVVFYHVLCFTEVNTYVFCVSGEIGSVRLPIHAICIDWWIPLLLKSVSMIGCGDFGWEG